MTKERKLNIGDKAIDFTLEDKDGNKVSLSDYRGKKVILYFYPKDNTPGCTKQACNFRDNYPQIQEKGAVGTVRRLIQTSLPSMTFHLHCFQIQKERL